MKNINKLTLCATMALALMGGLLSGCNKAQDPKEGDYKYIGWNGLANAEEDWKLAIASGLTYTLSLTNDFVTAKYNGTVSKNSDGTYLLKHVSSADANYPYPTICFGFKAVDAAGTDWECTGKFDFTALTFTPNGDKTALPALPALSSSVAA